MRLKTLLKTIFVLFAFMAVSNVSAGSHTETYTFTSTTPTGWTSSATTAGASGYAKMKSGEGVEAPISTLVSNGEVLSSALRVNVSAGTFSTWSSGKTITINVALLDENNSVLSSASYQKTNLGNDEGTYVANDYPISVSLPTNPAAIAKVRVTFTLPTNTNVMRFKYLKLNYSTETAAVTPTVTFSPIAGTYSSQQTITLTTNVDADYPTVYYTIDGTEPTDNNYDGYKSGDYYYNILDEVEPLVVSASCTVRARIYDYAHNITSDVFEAEYTITNPSPVINASNVNIAYNATSGTINYTIENPNGSTMTAAKTDGEWISNVAVDASNNKVTFDATANTGAERTGTIRLTYGTETKDVTVTQAAAEYTVTIVTPDNGTLEVKNGNTAVSTGDKFAVGTVLTVTATPNTGYKFRNWQAVDGSTHTYTTATTYTMGESNVTLKANFDEIVSYVVSWSVNGVVVRTDDVEENTAITFPTTISGIPSGYTLQGWVVEANKISGTQNSAPTYVTSATCTADITYYAVMAIESGSTNTADLTQSEITTNITNTTCAYGTAKTYADGGVTWTVCAYTDAASRPWMQLKKANNSYIKIAAPSKITEISVTITSATNSSGGIADITRHTDFGGTLYVDTEAKGTPTGGLGTTSSISNDVMTIRPTGDNSTIYLQVSTGARVWGIDLTYSSSTISNYCTTVPSVTVSVGAKGYATMVNSNYALDFTGKSIQAYTITSNNGSTLTLTPKPLVAQNEPVLLYSATNSDSQNIPIIPSATADSDNKLVAGTGAALTWTTDNKYYILYTGGDNPGFYKANNSVVAVGKAYLDLTGVNASRSFFTFDFDNATGISDAMRLNDNGQMINDNIYDLQGRRVATPQKGGLYIMNGKKVVVK